MSEGPDSNPYESPANVPPVHATTDEIARNRVTGPAVGLMITSGIGGLIQLVSIPINLIQFDQLGGLSQQPGQMEMAIISVISVGSGCVGLLVAAFILFGAIKMWRLENHTLAMISSILAMLPCVSPCCVLGLPFGIWSIVVLSDADVKAAFHS